jgi:peptidoglycan hydrolase-like protein with peptidoglycan-binding domain
MNAQQKEEYERLHPRVASGRTGGGQFKVKQGQGMEGQPDEHVREMQRAINAAPGTGKVAADGRFGPITSEAVKTFQRSQNINANGIVDDNTREALRSPAPLTYQQVVAQEKKDAKPASRAGSSSRRSTGTTARSGGASSTSSRVSLDPSSPHDIEGFQREHGLKVDGVIGPDTQRALRHENHQRRTGSEGGSSVTGGHTQGGARSRNAPGDSTERSDGGTGTLRKGDGGERAGKQVKQMQTMLEDLGYDLGEGGVDGELGPDTEAAVKKLQDEYGLEPDGVIGPRTRKLLNRLSGRLGAEKKAQTTGKAPTTGYKLIEGEDMDTTKRLAEDAWGGKPGTNFTQVTPAHRKKINPIVRHYMGKAHPFTACVRDNTKRFGPERAKKVCAVVKDMGEGTTKWRKGGKKVSETEMIRHWTTTLLQEAETEDDVVILAAYLKHQALVDELQEAQARRVLAETGTEQARALARERVLRARLQEAEVAPATNLSGQIASLNVGSMLRAGQGEVYRVTESSFLVLTGGNPWNDPMEPYTRKRVSSAGAAASILNPQGDADTTRGGDRKVATV